MIDPEIAMQLYDPSSKKQRKGSWLDFVKAHKSMRTAKGLLDLKAISKLWKEEKSKGYDLVSQKKKLNRLRAMRSKYLEHATKEQYRDAIREQKRIAKSAKRSYDPAPFKNPVYVAKWKKANEEVTNIKAERAEFNKSKRLGIVGIEARLRRGRKIGIDRRLKDAINFRDNVLPVYHKMDTGEKAYDPAPRKAHGLSKPPKNWFAAMYAGIKHGSDVRNPAAIVSSIWQRLSPAKRASIKAKEAKGGTFKYDLPLPEDMQTRGTGTLRMVKPFKLAEVQVNLSVKDYLHALKSGLFSRMKRGDGTTALVKRCKSSTGNANIFIDKIGGT